MFKKRPLVLVILILMVVGILTAHLTLKDQKEGSFAQDSLFNRAELDVGLTESVIGKASLLNPQDAKIQNVLTELESLNADRIEILKQIDALKAEFNNISDSTRPYLETLQGWLTE